MIRHFYSHHTLGDYLAENHLAHVVDEAVEEVDSSKDKIDVPGPIVGQPLQ